MIKDSIHIALVGDYNSNIIAHKAIPLAIDLAAKNVNVNVCFSWIPTASLVSNALSILSQYQAIWSVPGSPYKSMEGALNAITFAREQRIPFLGTCGGFQHVLIEYARKILLLHESDHLESSPHAALPLISPLACSLIETKGTIVLKQESKIKRIYGQEQIVEAFNCNFGVNPDYQHLFETNSTLLITGKDQAGNVRIVELDNHPFFIGTLYQPERSSFMGICHPLIRSFILAANKPHCFN
jgi:CTP synthase (UTP-ammonia lyase)